MIFCNLRQSKATQTMLIMCVFVSPTYIAFHQLGGTSTKKHTKKNKKNKKHPLPPPQKKKKTPPEDGLRSNRWTRHLGARWYDLLERLWPDGVPRSLPKRHRRSLKTVRKKRFAALGNSMFPFFYVFFGGSTMAGGGFGGFFWKSLKLGFWKFHFVYPHNPKNIINQF